MKVRWRLHSNDPWEPTTRLRGTNVIDVLRTRGWDAGAWNGSEQCDAIVVQWALREGEVAKLRQYCRRIVYEGNDAMFLRVAPHMHLPTREQLRHVDLVISGSPLLEKMHGRVHGNVRFIPDGIEPMYADFVPPERTGPVRLTWHGLWDNTQFILPLLPILRDWVERGNRVRIVTNKAKALPNMGAWAGLGSGLELVEWDLARAADQVGAGDFGLAWFPQNRWCRCKSTNKAATMMAMRMPVVATNAPTHRELIHHAWDGFLCATPGDVRKALDWFAHREVCRVMGERAREAALAMCGMARIGDLWEEALRSLRLHPGQALR